MSTVMQRKFRNLAMEKLQRECESNSEWWTWGPLQKLRYRKSKLMSFELNEGGLYDQSLIKRTREGLNALSARAWDGWTSDFATLLLFSFEATRHINRLARRDPNFVKKFAFNLGAWPILCKNKVDLDNEQCRLLDSIGIAKQNEFRLGVAHKTSKKETDILEPQFVFLWMKDHWRQRHLLGEDSGSEIAMLFLGNKIWPRWYLKRLADVSREINALKKNQRELVMKTLKPVFNLPSPLDPRNHDQWSAVALQIYSATITTGIWIGPSAPKNTKGNTSRSKKMPPSLFKKKFLSILKGRPGGGRPRKRTS